MTELLVSLPPDATRARYALDALAGLLGARLREVPSGATADLAYDQPNGRVRVPAAARNGWDENVPSVTRVGAVPALHPPGDPPSGEGIGFDILYATYACLTAPWERTDPTDEVGCPIAHAGFLARHGILREPLVHRYAALLGNALGLTLTGEPRLVLTHDVDDNFAHLFARRVSIELLRRDLAARRPAAVRRAAGLARRLASRPEADPNDRFDEWAAWHSERSSRPCYFVAAAGILSPGSARQDVPYEVTHPEVRAVLGRAVASGAEIGVHFSIRARESAERLRTERAALEEAVGTPVRSARHHWWAIGEQPERTWTGQAAAGIALDCSLGFNDAPGFRRGICVPFRPFDPETERPLGVHVLPTIAMDAALPADSIADELRSLEGIVRDVRGALVLDWHVHAANPRALPGAVAGLTAFARGSTLESRTPLELLAERGFG